MYFWMLFKTSVLVVFLQNYSGKEKGSSALLLPLAVEVKIPCSASIDTQVGEGLFAIPGQRWEFSPAPDWASALTTLIWRGRVGLPCYCSPYSLY